MLTIPPSDHPLDAEPGPREPQPHGVLESWTIAGHAGDRLVVDVAAPDSDPVVVVVAAHGLTGSRAAPYIAGAAKGWASVGVATVSFDFPFHGDRVGEGPPERAQAPEQAMRALGDMARVVDLAGERFPGPPVGFLGFSMGALLGVPFVAADARFAGACFVLAGSNARRIRYSGPELTPEQEAAVRWSDPATYAPGVGDRPVLMLNADRDEQFDRLAALDLYDAFDPPKMISFFPGTHTGWPNPRPVYEAMLRFFEGLA